MSVWAIVVWAALGVVVGAGLNSLARRVIEPTVSEAVRAARTITASVTGVLHGLLAWRLALWPELAAYSALAAIGVLLAVIDVIEHRLPSRLIAVGYLLLLALFGFAAVVRDNGAAMVRAAASMGVVFVVYLVLAVATNGGLGAGDVKLAGLLGLALGWLSWSAVLAGIVVGLFYGAVAGALLMALGKATPRSPIPLGPAMLAGAFTAVLSFGT
ncbi:prepilin peptidase [Lentzea tibetensis]|uniref:prepilin peptidase n=1 Tax=Lentzea tibetensis TaxID=2591470 RepID=UPI001F43D581|nr:prepilin peptidase [Lentzea tibetensis]